MADRGLTVRVPQFVKDELTRLKNDLEMLEGQRASQDEIVAALIHGVTVAQLSGMLRAFVRDEAASVDSDE